MFETILSPATVQQSNVYAVSYTDVFFSITTLFNYWVLIGQFTYSILQKYTFFHVPFKVGLIIMAIIIQSTTDMITWSL